jgi:hypothetical protein
MDINYFNKKGIKQPLNTKFHDISKAAICFAIREYLFEKNLLSYFMQILKIETDSNQRKLNFYMNHKICGNLLCKILIYRFFINLAQ